MNIEQKTQAAFENARNFLAKEGIEFQVLEHAPEGRTEEVSVLRGHDPEQALKCMVVLVKIGKKQTRFVLAVVRGNQKVDFKLISRVFGASYVGFAQPEKAAELTGCDMGTVLPFSFSKDLTVLADESLLSDDRLVYFNAGLLNKSIAISAASYLRAANGRVAPIGQPQHAFEPHE